MPIAPINCIYPETPADIKDANEWLVKFKANESHVHNFLNEATSWLDAEIIRVGNLTGLEREDGIRELFQYAHDLDEFALTNFKAQMGKIGIKARMFNELLKASESNIELSDDDHTPQILGDDVPLLSPALGFHKDVAMVTIAVIEHTKDNRLNTQPYMVTSTRELRRLTGEHSTEKRSHFAQFQMAVNSSCAGVIVIFNAFCLEKMPSSAMFSILCMMFFSGLLISNLSWKVVC